MGRRIGRLMIPLHKASRLSGGYVECSPRHGSPRSGLEDCHGEVDVLPEPNVERLAHCEQEMASKCLRDAPEVRHSALGDTGLRGRDRVHHMGGAERRGGHDGRAESRGGTTITTIHDWLRAWQCV